MATGRLLASTLMVLLGASAVSAASLVLPSERYGNSEGCAFLKTGAVDTDALQFLTPTEMGTYGAQCSFVDVNADPAGHQRADAICGHEGEQYYTAETLVIPRTTLAAPVTVYTATGELWGKLEPCL